MFYILRERGLLLSKKRLDAPGFVLTSESSILYKEGFLLSMCSLYSGLKEWDALVKICYRLDRVMVFRVSHGLR